MKEYIKQMKSGKWVAKRGYCYFLYASKEDILHDDAEVAKNLDRLNNHEPVFNRCYDGSWITYSRKLSDIKTIDTILFTE